MREGEYKAKEKKVLHMTRDGLVEDNLATGDRENVSKRIEDADFRTAENRINEKVLEPMDKAKKVLRRRNYYQNLKKGKMSESKLQSDYNKTPEATPSGDSGGVFTPSGKLNHLEKKADRVDVKLEKAKKKVQKKHSLKVQRVFDEERGKATHKLHFEEFRKPAKNKNVIHKGHGIVTTEGKNFIHNKMSKVEKENSGVEAGHKGEQAVEGVLQYRSNRANKKRERLDRNVSKLERRSIRTNTNYQYCKYIEENPQMKKKLLNKFFQKQRIRREYQKAYKSGKDGTKAVHYSAQITTKIAKKMKEILGKNKALLGAGLMIGILLILVIAGVSSCAAIFSDTVTTIMYSCWLSEPKDIDSVDLSFTKKEADLQNMIDNVESDNPGYDEYRYNLGSIGHDPFELISYLSAKFEIFTADMVSSELDNIFSEMYTYTTTEVVEIRTRTETQTTVNGEEEIDVEYEYYILDVKLVVKPITNIVAERLNTEQAELFAAYQESKGGLQQFGTPLNLYWYSYISSYYGYRKHPISGETQLHRGLDIAVLEGTEVLAGHNGTVTMAAYDNYYGNYIVILDSLGFETKYAHLSSVNVTAGQNVVIGDVIGTTGNTGNSIGSHLHLEVLYNGEYYNPLFYFNVGEGTLYGETPGEGGNVIPPESYDDETVQRLMNEAEKYLGMPYTFGGTPPTSFDCSAFVCWVFSNSGTYDLPRTTAQGIYDQCILISASEAKAGDLIFFTGTYNAGRPVTHVGIYCGNGLMIHCGDPIKYESINTSYWQSHFYGFGRLN